jgi:UDP-glucose 4-epimerase
MNKKDTSILITGGCGLIGSNFVKKIINNRYNIIIIDNLSSGYLENLKKINFFSKNKNKIKFYNLDLSKKKDIEKVFVHNYIDYIFHFAAISNVEMSIKNPKKILQNNINSTKNLIYYSKKYQIKNFIFSSSAAVYGNVNFFENIKENFGTNPINPYGKSKLTCENIIKKNLKNTDMNYCIFRYFNVVGKHLSNKIIKSKNLNLFEKISFCIKSKKILEIYGSNLDTLDGTPVRDYIHIDDVIAAHKICLNNKKIKFWNNIYNIGYNKGISVLDIILECKKIFKEKLKYKFIDGKKGIIQKSIANNKKFTKISNWKPKYSKIKKMVRSYFV